MYEQLAQLKPLQTAGPFSMCMCAYYYRCVRVCILVALGAINTEFWSYLRMIESVSNSISSLLHGQKPMF